MVVRYLGNEEKQFTRKMWEEIFAEDSKQFLDYYYNWKTKENRILVLEEAGKMRAMLQQNPYAVNINDTVLPTHYIVGVATEKEYRHRGYMRALLTQMLKDMYDREEAFTFLMPAAEAIYKPFGFQFVYAQNRGRMNLAQHGQVTAASADGKGSRLLVVRMAKEEDCQALAEFSQRILSQNYQVFAHRDAAYFETLLHEQKSENGAVMMITSGEEIAGYFFYGIEVKAEVRELVVEPEYEAEVFDIIAEYFEQYKVEAVGFQGIHNEGIQLEDEKQVPVIMARIVHLPQFIKEVKAEQKIAVTIQIQDEMINENNGCFYLQMDANGGVVRKAEDLTPDLVLSIGALTGILFGYLDIPKELRGIKPLQPVFLNEIV